MMFECNLGLRIWERQLYNLFFQTKNIIQFYFQKCNFNRIVKLEGHQKRCSNIFDLTVGKKESVRKLN